MQTSTRLDTGPLLPVPAVQGLRPYSSGRPAQGIDLFLDSNEGPTAPPRLAAVLAQIETDQLRRYPSRAELEARIAGHLGLEPGQILVTAGADDAAERAIRAVCGPGRRAILTTPSFEMLGRYVRLTGAQLQQLEWWSGRFPVDEVLALASTPTSTSASASASAVSLVTVVSPNNPTGAVISGEDLRRLALALPGALILLDHAYVELADEDLTGVALELPNALVLRTFSKAWGAAGLRVGYAAGSTEIVGWLRSVGQPYSVSALSLALIEELLRFSRAPDQRVVETVRAQRQRLAALCEMLGLEPLPSQANFVLVRAPAADRLRQRLAALGIAVRGFAGHPLLEQYLRITVPGEAEAFERLAAALRTALAPQALLLDMDGVLADVSRSYRRAIALTAAGWGVELTPAEIAAAKAEQCSTNDWVLTHRLLQRHGVTVPLEQVTSRFEALYQGDPCRPGLRETETPLVDRAFLERLGERLRLAVVTGRPRRDAASFLERFDLAGCFETVVALEDAPGKPDPAPVQCALERLGVTTAWMVGDTPDDMRAARAAGVLPIGVVAPGDDAAAASAALGNAGAAEVLGALDEILDEILDILPREVSS